VLPAQQHSLDSLGLAWPCLCTHRSANRLGNHEHSWCLQEWAGAERQFKGL